MAEEALQVQAPGGLGFSAAGGVGAPATGEALAVAPPRPEFQIVPLRGLPIVAAILAGLVAVVATDTRWGVDFYHVVGGAFSTALDLFLGFVLGPILGRLSIPARVEMTTRLIMPTVVTCTLVGGLQLARQTGDMFSSYPHHSWVVASMIVVAVMAVVALGILEPANLAVLFELKKPRPDGEIIARLMRRFIYSAGITGAMQVATLIIMTRISTS
jgi:hypothetical protein